MKQLIGVVLAVAFSAVVLAFWIAPGWSSDVMYRALGLPTYEQRNTYSKLKAMLLSDLKQRGAGCANIKDVKPNGRAGTDTLLAVVSCTGGEMYDVRMHKQSPWEYSPAR